jgi:hypothetical protein
MKSPLLRLTTLLVVLLGSRCAVGIEDMSSCHMATSVGAATDQQQQQHLPPGSQSSRYQGACVEQMTDEDQAALDIHQTGIDVLERKYSASRRQ